MSSAPARISSRNSWLVRNLKNIVLNFLFSSNQYHWTWTYLQVFLDFSGGFPVTLVLCKYSTRTQSVVHHFQVIIWKNRFVETLPLDLPIFDLLLQDLTFSHAWDEIWINSYFCLWPLDRLIMSQRRSCPWRRCTFNHFQIQNLALLVLFLRNRLPNSQCNRVPNALPSLMPR